jgi:hypothetical protein
MTGRAICTGAATAWGATGTAGSLTTRSTGSGLAGDATDVSPVNGFLYSLFEVMTSMELG